MVTKMSKKKKIKEGLLIQLADLEVQKRRRSILNEGAQLIVKREIKLFLYSNPIISKFNKKAYILHTNFE